VSLISIQHGILIATSVGITVLTDTFTGTMDPVTKETSPAPSSKGLKGVLAKARRGLKDNSSTLSVNSTDNSSSSHGGIRSSIDSKVEKLKSRATGESSHNDGDNPGSGGIAKLLPRRSRKKRRAREAPEQDQEEAIRGRSIGDRRSNGATGDLDPFEITGENQSPLDDDGGSSLLTYDSDPES